MRLSVDNGAEFVSFLQSRGMRLDLGSSGYIVPDGSCAPRIGYFYGCKIDGTDLELFDRKETAEYRGQIMEYFNGTT